MIHETVLYDGGELVETVRLDDEAGTYTRLDAQGTVVETRPMTDEEAADAAARSAGQNKSAIQTNLEQDQAAMQAIIDTANATLNASPAASLKNIARNLKRLNRVALSDYDGTT